MSAASAAADSKAPGTIPAFHAVHNTGLEVVRCETEHRVLRYDRLQSLMHELKTLGAHNVNSRRDKGLSSRQRLIQLLNAYEQQRQPDGCLPATYEIYYLELRRESQ